METMAWYENVWLQVGGVLLASVLFALLSQFVTHHTFERLAKKTVSVVDDKIAAALKKPIAVSILLVGVWYALVTYKRGAADEVPDIFKALLISSAIIVWSRVLIVCGRVFLFDSALSQGRHKGMANRLLPILDSALKIIVVVLSSYYVMLAWGVDVSGWIASAGILGVAIGLAAQETLGHMLAGVALMADGPYKLGDWLVLATGERGKVTDIGVRSTRMLTVDGIELVVPNSIMANSIVINESGGGSDRVRMSLPIGVAYGTDLEQAKQVVLDTVAEEDGVIHGQTQYAPSVHFREFGGSSLNLELHVWLHSPRRRPELTDRLNMRIYRALNTADIEIPFETHSVFVKNSPE